MAKQPETEKPATAATVNGFSTNNLGQVVTTNNNIQQQDGQEDNIHQQIKNRLDGFRYLADLLQLPLIKVKGKKPVGIKWQQTDYRAFDQIGFNNTHNAGILTGRISGLIVLDIDDETLFKHETPETFTVKTGKGYHHYFQLPDDGKEYGNRSIQAQGFDIKAEGGFLVAPFSIHPDTGKKYKIVNNIPFAGAPDWLLELSLKTDKQTTKKAVNQFIKIEHLPPSEELVSAYQKLLSKSTPVGKRSERIYHALHELIEDGLTDQELIGLFEKFPDGIGEKYLEKGGNRVNWLFSQIQQIREKIDSRKVSPFKAKNQLWVKALHADIMKTFTKEYKLSICEKQSQAIKEGCDLFIGLLNNEHPDWYCLPFPVGTGKTETIKHLIKFLDKHDTDRRYSIALSLEKITEINDVKKWLLEHGVSEDYFQVVHHQVDNLTEVFEKMKETPVIIHTHYKLKGATYLYDYFKYNGQERNILIFDESMLSSMVSANRSSTIASYLDRFSRGYIVNPKMREEIPKDIYTYFEEINADTAKKETILNSSSQDGEKVPVEIPAEYLKDFEYPELVKLSSKIETFVKNRNEEEIPIYRELLTIGKSPSELRQVFLQKEKGQPILFAMKEVMSSSIKNLVTTDASREIRTLFNFSEKQVKILDVEPFRTYEGLNIHGIEFPGGQDKVKKAFDNKAEPNPYLLMLEEIFKKEKNDHTNFLIFHSKQLGDLPVKVKYHLCNLKGIIDKEKAENLHFCTFGRENATNDYKDCGCIIFLGLHYKPTYALRANLLGEMKGSCDVDHWMIDKVEEGELTVQIQQGSGRGRIRNQNEENQSVYFCAYNPEVFFRGLRKAFPKANVQTCNFESIDNYLEEKKANKPSDDYLEKLAC